MIGLGQAPKRPPARTATGALLGRSTRGTTRRRGPCRAGPSWACSERTASISARIAAGFCTCAPSAVRAGPAGRPRHPRAPGPHGGRRTMTAPGWTRAEGGAGAAGGPGGAGGAEGEVLASQDAVRAVVVQARVEYVQVGFGQLVPEWEHSLRREITDHAQRLALVRRSLRGRGLAACNMAEHGGRRQVLARTSAFGKAGRRRPARSIRAPTLWRARVHTRP